MVKRIEVLFGGHYDAPNNKVRLLRAGDVLDVIGETGPTKVDNIKPNCWQCLTEDNRLVYVEQENAQVTVIGVSLHPPGWEGNPAWDF
jgi:hypothetical protein